MPRNPTRTRAPRRAPASRSTPSRGAGTREQQIDRLRSLIGPKGEAEARTIQESYPPEVIRYAARTDARRGGVVRDTLGPREQDVYDGLKAELGPEEADTWKRLTLAGKRARRRTE